ncbi:DUF501 domain-containing protein [Fuchsiella alkaliacetigena]|uniref:DUF501 domain-containing protein n=1 Tax=Fuchsiella alkaliacetigena TaxID=957042 RepID=UPI00200B973D|nr:DUF501 domain-containing protein [Fuchsiella alkaliacetigena]MCK8824902.1 DUF501 domain-containing protein [Fuchsiella alkaliacetigena]
MKKEVEAEEMEIIIEQLGRTPRNLLRVEKYCAYGYPEVLTTYPLLVKQGDYGVFPTTYWLSCPKLVNEISKLEAVGQVKKIQSIINNNPQQFAQLKTAYQNYAQARVDLLTEEDLKRLPQENPELWRVISESGVGGIMNEEGIKCLHTHYADFLVNGVNPVGEIVAKLLNEKFNEECKSKCGSEKDEQSGSN